MPGAKTKVSVTLENEHCEQKYISVEDGLACRKQFGYRLKMAGGDVKW